MTNILVVTFRLGSFQQKQNIMTMSAAAHSPEVDFFSLHNRKKKKIDIEMLDYGFVEQCKDLDELKGILAMLRSGKEGRYPDLERATENRILEILPPKERKKIIEMRAGPSGVESASEKKDLESWTQQIDMKHQALQEQKNRSRSLPPVRGQVQQNSDNGIPLIVEVCDAQPSKPRVKQAIPAYDFRAWEKYDVDSAIREIDRSDQDKLEQARIDHEQREQRSKDRKKELASLPSYICLEDLSMEEREVCALHEKQKGNESFKVNENEDAILYYTRSIAFDDSNAIVYANRAMAHLRMKNFSQAEADCTRAITLDATYNKAWTRRGMTRFRRGKYAEAIADFEHVLTMDPDNKEVEKLLSKTQTKWKEVDGTIDDNQASNDISATTIQKQDNAVDQQTVEKPFKRMAIVEHDDDDDDEDDDANDPSNNNVQEFSKIKEKKPFQRFEIIED